MSLNVKLALLISVAFIAGLCWVVQRAGRPVIAEPSPLVPRDGGGAPEPRATTPSPRTTETRTVSTTPFQFARPAPVEANRSETRQVSDTAETPARRLPTVDSANVPLPPFLATSRLTPAADVAVAPRTAGAPIVESELKPRSSHDEQVDAPRGVSPASPPIAVAKPQPDTTVSQVEPATSGSGAAETQAYRVQAGDTLVKIARRELKKDDTATVQKIVELNPQLKKRADRILAGEELKLPAVQTPSVAAAERARDEKKLVGTPQDKHKPIALKAVRPDAAIDDRAGVDAYQSAASPNGVMSDVRVPAAGDRTGKNRAPASNEPANASKTDARAKRGGAAGGGVAATSANARTSKNKSARAADTAKPTARQEPEPPQVEQKTAPARKLRSSDATERVALKAGSKPGAKSGNKPAATAIAKAPAKAAARNHVVQANESLKTIAGRELQNPERWREIAALNKLKDPNRVLAGAKLRLPGGDRVARR